MCNIVRLFTKRLEKHTESGSPVHQGVIIVIINTLIKKKKTGLEQLRVILGSSQTLTGGATR